MKKSFIFLSLFLLSVFANNAFAQVSFTCPLSNQIPPFGIPWTDAGCVDVPIPGGSGTGCVVNVCLCERTLADGTIEFSIKSIWPKFPGSNCNGISWQFIIETAINAVPTNVNSFGSFPPCPSDFPTSVAVVAQACWKLINTNVDPTKAPNYAAIPCTGESGYCITTYAVCDDHGTLVPTKLSTQSVTGDCTDIPVSGEWEPGVCYTLNYCAD